MQNCWSAGRAHEIIWQKRNAVLKGKSKTSMRKMAAGEQTGQSLRIWTNRGVHDVKSGNAKTGPDGFSLFFPLSFLFSGWKTHTLSWRAETRAGNRLRYRSAVLYQKMKMWRRADQQEVGESLGDINRLSRTKQVTGLPARLPAPMSKHISARTVIHGCAMPPWCHDS